MADKNVDQIQKPTNAKDYEMKVSGSSIQSSNRFQVLDFPPITMATQIKNSSKPQNASTSPSSPYFTKTHSEHMLLTTFTTVPDYKTLQAFLNKLLPLGCQWIPDDPARNQRYYEFILVDSGSAEFYHTMDKNNPDKIAYSKCVIKKVIKPTEWVSFVALKDFSVHFIPKGYSYYDYKMAWYRIFLYRPFDHSWFFTFHNNCLDEFPILFYEWWHSYGPTTDILPPVVLKGFNTYQLKTKGLYYVKALQYYKEFKVPWIFCWSFKIDQHYSIADKFPMSLFREYKIKWWDKFDQSICSDSAVDKFIQTGVKLQHQIHQVAKQAESPKTPAKPKSTMIIKKTPIQIPQDSDSDDDMQQFIAFKKFQKLQKKLKESKASSTASSSSTDPIGGQDPYDFDL